MKKENIIDSFVSISHIKDHKENEFETVKKISFNDIYKMSQNIEKFKKTNEFKLIFESKNLTKVFYSFLKRDSKFFVPKAVAASSEMNVREFDGGKLTINKSNKNNGTIYFGEITFHHMSGFAPIEPKIYDINFGKKLKILYLIMNLIFS